MPIYYTQNNSTIMSHLVDYCRKLLAEKRLVEQRKIGIFDDYESFSIELVKTIIDIDHYNYIVCEKHNGVGFSMNWHLDDGAVIKHSKDKMPTHSDHTVFAPLRTIYYSKKKPVYSLLIYDSTHGVDFTGGTLEFCDGTMIYPRRGMYVLFSSEELHRVHIIKSGTRDTWLIKFYSKDK